MTINPVDITLGAVQVWRDQQVYRGEAEQMPVLPSGFHFRRHAVRPDRIYMQTSNKTADFVVFSKEGLVRLQRLLTAVVNDLGLGDE